MVLRSLLVVLLLMPGVGFALGTRSVTSSAGTIYVGGRGSDKQVLFRQGNSTRAITRFAAWEDIEEILLSKDERLLLIYHRPDKARAFQLTVIRMDSLSILNSIKPGYGGQLFWTKQNNILLIYGCGSQCAGFLLLNDSLKTLAADGGYCLESFLDENIIVSLPCIGGAMGEFKIWSLKDGALLSTKTFEDKYGETCIICEEASARNGKLRVRLLLENDRVANESITY